jgi:hypothetical protein
MKNSGFGWGFPEGSEARVVLYGESEIERAELYTAAADVGQGAHSVLAQIAAEVLSISLDRLAVYTSDTATSDEAGPASASRLTMIATMRSNRRLSKPYSGGKTRIDRRPAVAAGTLRLLPKLILKPGPASIRFPGPTALRRRK